MGLLNKILGKLINVEPKLADKLTLTGIVKAALIGEFSYKPQHTHTHVHYHFSPSEAEKLRGIKVTPELEEKYTQEVGKRLASNASALKALSEPELFNEVAKTSVASALWVIAVDLHENIGIKESVRVEIGNSDDET